jgi:hypothetical protein
MGEALIDEYLAVWGMAGVRTLGVSGQSAHLIAQPAGDARPLHSHRLCWKDILSDSLESTQHPIVPFCYDTLLGFGDESLPAQVAAGPMSLCVLQIGWVTGPADLLGAVTKAHQFITFTVPSSLQYAVAYGLDHEADFYRYFEVLSQPRSIFPFSGSP